MPLSGCVRFSAIGVEPVSLASDTSTASSAVRLHLLDGSTILYPSGIQVTDSGISGEGRRFDPTGAPAGRSTLVRADSVAQAVRYRTNVQAGPTIGVNLGMAAIAGGIVLFLMMMSGLGS